MQDYYEEEFKGAYYAVEEDDSMSSFDAAILQGYEEAIEDEIA